MSLHARELRVFVVISMFNVSNFDVKTNILFAIVRLLRCSVAEGDCVSACVFLLYDVNAHFTCSDFADTSPVGARVINYVFGFLKKAFIV